MHACTCVEMTMRHEDGIRICILYIIILIMIVNFLKSIADRCLDLYRALPLIVFWYVVFSMHAWFIPSLYIDINFDERTVDL